MNILHVIPSLSKGGAERITIDICNTLADQGHKVMLLSMSEINAYNFIPFKFEYRQTYSTVVPSITSKSIVETEDYEQILDEFKPEVIHSHLFLAEMLTRFNPRKGIKYFTHLHDNMPQFAPFSFSKISKQRITNFFEKQMMLNRYEKCNNNFVAISKDAFDFFYTNLNNHLKKRIHLLHNAIDYQRFYRGFRNFKLDKDGNFRIVSVGSLVDKKNQQFLIDILLALIPLIPHVHIDVLGDGPNHGKIVEKIKKYNLQHKITLHGNVNNVEEFLHQAHLYVHPATYEPFGLVLIEAMAAGLPCVCLDGRGNRDVIEQDKNGYIFKEQNPTFFANAIQKLLLNPIKLQEMSNFAIHYAAKFDMPLYIKRLLDLYQKD
ncbi:MAG TPA: glycosyltransferase family 4 protein [Bacteroidia bacterium]|nr:glycosyltransferase family 4 protein [Bacteroidia bacterium]